jgi:uncharacterized protein (DUF427 family)
MAKSPGHREHANHRVQESPLGRRATVSVGGEAIADSADVLKLEEDGYRARYYFPRSDVKMDKLVRSQTTTYCPFKGTAHYFSIPAAGDSARTLADAVWTYEEPYEEHPALKDRVAFWDDKFPEIAIHVQA